MTDACTNPPAPAGYRVWRGSVPKVLTDWAIGLRNHIASYPFGQTWTTEYNGQTVVARCDCHSWTYRNGQLLTGLHIKDITLYSPLPATLVDSPQPQGDPLATPDPSLAAALFNPPPAGVVSPWAVAGTLAVAGGVLYWLTR